MEFNVKICNLIIKIQHNFNNIRALCDEFTVSNALQADICVSVSEDAIAAEKRQGGEAYSDAACEATCIHRELTCRLVKYGIILMHSVAVAVDGVAYIFMAKSGVGKSTHAKLWLDSFGDRAKIINGDKPYFSFVGDTFTVHGSPFKGKEGWGENISMPVGAICFLERSDNNYIEPIESGELVSKLFHQVLIPKDAADVAAFMAIVNRITRSVPFYRLRCNMDKNAALVAYGGMKGEQAK